MVLSSPELLDAAVFPSVNYVLNTTTSGGKRCPQRLVCSRELPCELTYRWRTHTLGLRVWVKRWLANGKPAL